MQTEPWLVARDLRKEFDGVVAVADASVAVQAGEVRGIVGPNGAGKSTLMQMFAGALVPDAGEIVIDGAQVSFVRPADALAAGISLVPQEMRLAMHLTVTENIVLGREPTRLGRVLTGRSRQIAVAALDRLDIAIDPDAAAESLTSVERRLVMVARALVGDARLIILDEPTAALAPHEADAILAMVRGLAQTGVSFLYVSHRFDDIEAVADSVTGVRDARIIADLPRAEFTRDKLVAMVTPVDQEARTPSARAVGGATNPPRKVVLECSDLEGSSLRGVSLAVAAGEIVGVAGLSGSGVNELMAVVAGITPRSGGTVSIKGTPIGSGDRITAVQAGIAYVPGDRSLAILPNHDIRTNISVSSLTDLATFGVPSATREATQVKGLMDRVQLKAKLSQTISSLSGGNQQKAMFARWMGRDATVLLLHDPTAGVDVRARAEIHERVRELAAADVAILLVTTDIAELAELSNRVLVLDRGRLSATLDGATVTEPAILSAMVAEAAVH